MSPASEHAALCAQIIGAEYAWIDLETIEATPAEVESARAAGLVETWEVPPGEIDEEGPDPWVRPGRSYLTLTPYGAELMAVVVIEGGIGERPTFDTPELDAQGVRIPEPVRYRPWKSHYPLKFPELVEAPDEELDVDPAPVPVVPFFLMGVPVAIERKGVKGAR